MEPPPHLLAEALALLGLRLLLGGLVPAVPVEDDPLGQESIEPKSLSRLSLDLGILTVSAAGLTSSLQLLELVGRSPRAIGLLLIGISYRLLLGFLL